MRPSFTTPVTMLMIKAAPLMIQYSHELTLYLRMSTDFSRWNVRCESEPGEACYEEKCNYIANLYIYIYIFICITTITL